MCCIVVPCLLHPGRPQVFKVARALAPAVVLVEDVDQVFVSDKTRAKTLTPPGGEPPNRIKKQLLAEVSCGGVLGWR